MDTLKALIDPLLRFFDIQGLSIETMALLLFFAAAATLALAVAGMLGDRGKTDGKRLSKDGKATPSATPQVSLTYGDASSKSPLQRLVLPLAEKLAPSDGERRSRAQSKLVQGGFYAPQTVLNYYAIRIVLAVALPLMFVPLIPMAASHSSPVTLVTLTLGLAVLGFMLPSFWLSLRVDQRRQRLRDAFPDALDLLLVCVESGQSLDGAIGRIAKEMRTTCPEMAEQFHLTGLELRAGRSRQQALSNMASRTGVDEIASFTTLLIQSDQLGTSMGDTLRVYAEDMRITRMLRAEEKAQALPAKIAVPLAMFLLPGFVIIIMVPTAIRIIRALGGTG